MRRILFALPILLAACGNRSEQTNSLAPAAFEVRLSEPGVQLVDARTPSEYNSGHLADAINLDWTGGQLEAAAGKLDKSKPVLLYCASGSRSAAAREFLTEHGFTDVMDLDGGIGAWVGAGKSMTD